MKFVHWVGCYIWYSEEGTGQAAIPNCVPWRKPFVMPV